MEIINWIETKMVDLEFDQRFKEYFNGKQLRHDAGLYYLTNPEKGIGIVINKGLNIETIHLYSGKTVDGKQFRQAIPHGLSFDMSQGYIRSTLGTPNRTGGGYKGITGYVPLWDKYYFSNYSLHLQYGFNKTEVEMITIASLKIEQELNALLQ